MPEFDGDGAWAPPKPSASPPAAGSYSEQYRGTQWDSSPPPTTPVTRSSGRGRSAVALVRWLFLLVGVIGLAMFGRGFIDGWNAGGVDAITPSATSSVVERFREVVADPGLAFHVKMSITVSGGPQPMQLVADLDMVGEDSAGKVRLTQGGDRIAVEMVVKDGVGYARAPGGGWQKVPGDEGTIESPFADLSPAIRYEDLGRTKRGQRMLHHLRTHDWTRDDLKAVTELFGKGATIESAVIDVYVTDRGVPVEMNGALAIGLPAPAGAHDEAQATFSYRFSRVGKPVAIKAPKV